MIAVLAAALVIAGCQNSGYLLKTYSASVARKHVVQTAGGSFWVFDRPDLGKIMTTPSPGTIAAPAIISGATVGLVKLDPVVAAHQAFALQYLAQTGRTCEIKTSVEIWRPEFEHTYVCSN
ncbi:MULTISPECIES: hypothetical protein [unclassified Mesorhizobium]|uniref:hypothetical protein n=1 Tax=unclassified Mesorhizobium TaxID=325217 RepID=UPI003338E76E